MAHLAIKGHPTRGNEVIELLEMLGGKNKYNVDAIRGHHAYFIENGIISELKINQIRPNQFIIFTLEEFLEKFPYKVGDKVLINGDVTDIYTIISMAWVGRCVAYKIRAFDGIDDVYDWFADEMKPYTEQIKETTETITLDDFKTNTKEWLIDKLESMSKDNALQAICNIHDELHKPQYPKTYKECCDVLGLNTLDNDAQGYKGDLIIRFQELLIARDSYWKIADDWKFNFEEKCYYLCNEYHEIQDFNGVCDCNAVLAFPTAEMRDAFFENFKELINECISLL